MKKLFLTLVVIAILVIPIAIISNQSPDQSFEIDEGISIVEAAGSNSTFTVSGNKITKYNSNYQTVHASDFPTDATTLGTNAFTGTNARYVELPSTITKIEAGAFWNSNVEKVIIPESVTSIGTGAFYRCTSLHTVICKFTDVSVFAFFQFSYTPSDFVLYVQHDCYDSFRTSARLGSYKNNVEIFKAKLVLNNNGGSGVNEVSIRDGQNYYEAIGGTPNKMGQHFMYWMDNANNVVIDEDSVFSGWQEQITLNAVYETEEYEIRFEYNNQTYWVNGYTLSDTISYTKYNQYTYKSNWISKLAELIHNPSINITDLNDSNGYNLQNCSRVPDLGEHRCVYVLTPVVEAKTYKITFDYYLNGGHVVYTSNYAFGDRLSRPIEYDTERPGYTYHGWTDDSIYVHEWSFTNSDYSKTISQKWYGIDYNLVLNYNHDNVANGSKTVTYGSYNSLPIPTRANYEFTGWLINGSIYQKYITWTVLGGGEAVAQWSPVNYSLELDANGGEILGSYPATFNCESNDITLPTPIKHGYNFMGWQDQNGNIIENNTITNKTHSYALTAQWSKTTISITQSGDYTINQEKVVVLDMSEFSVLNNCHFIISSNVDEVYFIGQGVSLFDDLNCNILVASRSTPLTITLENCRISYSDYSIDASNCPDLTIHNVGTNVLISLTQNPSPTSDATVKAKNLTITGDTLRVYGCEASLSTTNYRLPDGGAGINVNGNLYLNNRNLEVYGADGIQTNKIFYGPDGTYSVLYGGKGGAGIYFKGSNRSMVISSNSIVKIVGGNGGDASGEEVQGATIYKEVAGNGGMAVDGAGTVTISGHSPNDQFIGGHGGSAYETSSTPSNRVLVAGSGANAVKNMPADTNGATFTNG